MTDITLAPGVYKIRVSRCLYCHVLFTELVKPARPFSLLPQPSRFPVQEPRLGVETCYQTGGPAMTDITPAPAERDPREVATCPVCGCSRVGIQR